MAKLNGNLSSDNVRTIKELILDEQKCVTYLTLCKDLCIHVNEAKTLLKRVVAEIKENNANIKLSVNFLISGLTSNHTGLTTVCPESELDTRKITFKTIFYQHIYSVCLGSSGVDIAALACINSFEDILLCCGLIKNSSCTKRSSNEIGTLISNSQKVVDEVKPVVPSKKDIKEKTKEVTQAKLVINDAVKVHERNSEPVIKSEITSPKKDSTSSVINKSTTKPGAKASKGIAGFFAKSNNAPSIKPKVSKETVVKTAPKVEKEIQPNTKHEECMDVDEDIPIKDIKKEPESTKKSSNKKNSSLSQIKKNAKVDKKRKRVLHVSDSESDDDKDPFADDKPSNHESDDEIPPTPTINTVKIASGILNPKKRRKMVDKTYTDEEGYILTHKEEVYESCSEEEVETVNTEVLVKLEKENVEIINKVKTEVSPKEKKAKNSKKKVSPPQKGKQANIMNFFKKI